MKRLKRILRWGEIGLGVSLLIVLIANQCFVWATNARLNRQLAAIRQAGDPVSLAGLAHKPIPPEQNAATCLRQVRGEAYAVYQELQRVIDVQNSIFPPSAFAQEPVKRIIAAHPNVVPLLERAAACPDYDPQWNYALPPEQFFSQVAGVIGDCQVYTKVLLFTKAMPLAAEGRSNEAVRSMLTALQLARHFDCCPFLITSRATVTARDAVVDCVNAALQAGPVSMDTRSALDAQLAIEDRMDGHDWAIRTQRALFLDEFDSITPRDDWFVFHVFWNQQKSDALDMLQFYLVQSRTPSSYRSLEHALRESPTKAWGEGQAILPDFRLLERAVAHTRAKIRSLRTLIAVQCHVPADGKQVPQIAELGLPAEATTDPFTGGSLHIKRLPEGWLIYSVGDNFRDDGGRFDKLQADVGVGPLLNVAHSRKR